MPDGSKRHETDLAADHAIEFIRNASGDQPFSLNVSFNASHAEDSDKENHFPWPPATYGMYEDVDIPPPELSDEATFEAQPEFLKQSINRERYFWRWDTPEKYQKNMRAYFRMITGVDIAIGRVVKELQTLGMDRNTVIIYMADNGYYMGNRGFAGKWSHYEESLRIPLIIYDPRIRAAHQGLEQNTTALNIDITPTIVDMAGLGLPNNYQGSSLNSLIQTQTPAEWRQDFFCEHLMNYAGIPKWEGVRAQRYVYARYFEQQPIFEFLHDLQTDPKQLVNYSGDKNYTSVLEQMRQRCDQLRTEYTAG